MTGPHQRGELILTDVPVKSHSVSQLIDFAQAALRLLATARTGKVEVDIDVTSQGNRIEQDIHPLGMAELAGVEEIDRRWRGFFSRLEHAAIESTANDRYFPP